MLLALFESLGGIELVMVGIAALLLFGKDLPKVAADAGAQFSKFKRALDSTWRDSGLEREVRQIRDAIPRDLSLTHVARTASEKLAVRLEEEGRARAADSKTPGPVARGATIHDPLPDALPDGTPDAAAGHPAQPAERDPRSAPDHDAGGGREFDPSRARPVRDASRPDSVSAELPRPGALPSSEASPTILPPDEPRTPRAG